ncbi:MAG: zinc ABC transporter substrate-binding protein [Clostridia bacterium]|nr:zinc ABC transporter substrate-binding protein [Clostridia bacterium]
MFDVLMFLFSYSFMLRALAVGALISLCCALLGVSLVLKRFSMIGDGLSHVGFGALAIAAAANLAPLYFSIPIVVLAAFLLLSMNARSKLKGDAAIALISTGALAVGIMVTSMTTGMNVDVYNYMFGSILTMSDADVVLSVLLSVTVIVLFVVFYDEIFAVTFDETFAKATGTRVTLYQFLIAALTAVTIVVGMRMMGTLLISSLIIFPTVTSMRLCKSFRRVVLSSVGVSLGCFLIGLAVSVRLEAPTGAAIVCVNIAALGVFALLGTLRDLRPSSKLYGARRALTALVCVLALVLGLLPFFGPLGKGPADKNITVIATGFAPFDFARQVAGEDADVIMLLSPGEESHTFEPRPTQRAQIETSDVFIYGGGESDAWVEDLLSSVQAAGVRTVRMMDAADPLKEELLPGMQAEEEEDDAYDEHVWTSAANAILITQAICDALCDADAAHAEGYRARTAAYLKELEALDADLMALGKAAQGTTFVVGDRFPLLYFAKRYGVQFAAAFPGCSAQNEANPNTIAALTKMLQSQGSGVVFKMDLNAAPAAQSIARDTGARVETLYSAHTISKADFDAGVTYVDLMRRNESALRGAIRNMEPAA